MLALIGHVYTVAGTTAADPDQLAAADRWLASALEAGVPAVPVLADLGRVRDAEGELANSATLLDQALRSDPANPDILVLRGVVAARQADWETAESAFLGAARSAPDSPEPWENLARVYEMTDRADDARRAAARADDLEG